MIEIKNLRTEKPTKEFDVRVDRSSVLGNPFRMASEDKRDETCDKYAEYFQIKAVSDPIFAAELDRIDSLYVIHGKINLFCWCTPKRCHSETIMKYIQRKKQY